MDFITYDEFKNTNLYNSFIMENPAVGSLKINAYSADEAYPSQNTSVTIYKRIGAYNVLFYSGVTDENGVIDDIVLPAPLGPEQASLDAPKYTIYELDAEHNGFAGIKGYRIGMFGGVKVIQYLRMIPEVDNV